MNLLLDLLRDPKLIATRCRREEGLKELTATSLGVILVGAAVFGAAVGSFRGGLQTSFSALKLPLALFATLVVCVPAFFSLAAGMGKPVSMRSMVALTMAATARAALVLLALAPVLWLAIDLGLSYHGSVLLDAVLYGMSGLAALGVLLRGFDSGISRLGIGVACVCVFFAVSGQTAWMLRPFLGRPAHDSVPFVRAREGSFADSLLMSARSSVGIYHRERGRVDAAIYQPEVDIRRQTREPAVDFTEAEPTTAGPLPVEPLSTDISREEAR